MSEINVYAAKNREGFRFYLLDGIDSPRAVAESVPIINMIRTDHYIIQIPKTWGGMVQARLNTYLTARSINYSIYRQD